MTCLVAEAEALGRRAPSSGAYMNKADLTDPDWKVHCFGNNYDQLLEIKNQWDPDGVFWCKPCIGHDNWTVGNGFGDEGAIGQRTGKTCRRH
ncbi:uncharacterized protein A1O9_07405 [Exophiala aquamarina CBS 119918]|uniref:Berberine/berberine-like domain-containing protein n=1 Tax=Exophiala aquamarina CBS 119918 TaxID=1182545 RepID=A0A072PNY3_9EURO|nr:uncharacterized protein A1O9_07405 [Exophiala aquamarina CBS 119918]KEF57215.1 hypothetical protein A1O9_07405 [Exophiala aquamarina CBS 119918]